MVVVPVDTVLIVGFSFFTQIGCDRTVIVKGDRLSGP